MLPRAPLLFAVSMLLAACALFAPKFEKPDLSVVSIKMVGGNLLQQNFRVTMKIHNPNDRTLPVKGLTADLRVSGEAIASGAIDRPFTVAALGETEFDLTITANMVLALLKLSQHAENHSDNVPYELTGAVAIDLPFFRSLPFQQTGTFSLKGG